MVTVGAWDIAPTWLNHLALGGTIVVPLRMNGVSRSFGFRRVGDHLVSTSAEVCGFVPMQGNGAHDERVFVLPDGNGHAVKLRFDSLDLPSDMSLLVADSALILRDGHAIVHPRAEATTADPGPVRESSVRLTRVIEQRLAGIEHHRGHHDAVHASGQLAERCLLPGAGPEVRSGCRVRARGVMDSTRFAVVRVLVR